MKKSLLIAAVFLVSVSMPAMAGDDAHADSHGSAHWGYTGAGSAAHWGDLGEDYHACKDGKAQSPINIGSYAEEEELAPLEISYQDSPMHVVNNGHTIQFNYAPGSTLTVGNKSYELLQFHFHTPSEHYIAGAPYAMEVHFVHKAADGTLGVLGVMMKVGDKPNRVIDALWQNAPAAGESKIVESVTLTGAELLPSDLSYFKYEGSLTTPPCSEGVQWHVVKQPIEISGSQLVAFQRFFPVNARSIQRLNDRIIYGR